MPWCPCPQGWQGNVGRAQPHMGRATRDRCCERGGTAARHLPPGAVTCGGIKGVPGAVTVVGTPQHSAWDLGTRRHLLPDLKPTRIQGDTPSRRGDPGRPRRRSVRRGSVGAPAVMEQSPGRGGTLAPGCPASPGCGTLVSAGISGWEYEEGAGETLTCQGWGPSATSLLSPPPAWCCTQHLGLCLPAGTGTPRTHRHHFQITPQIIPHHSSQHLPGHHSHLHAGPTAAPPLPSSPRH